MQQRDYSVTGMIFAMVALVILLVSVTRAGRLASLVIPQARSTPPAATQAAAAATALFWQVGVSATADGMESTAMRTTIRTQIPATIANQSNDYYWIGSYLADGSFIQVGYGVSGADHTAHWFYCSFTALHQEVACPLGQPNSAGPAGSWHTYSLALTSQTARQQWVWTATMDNTVIGTITTAVASTGVMTPSVYAEVSAFHPIPATNSLGQVEFHPAIQLRNQRDPRYHTPQGATVAYSQANVCPPYGMNIIQANDVVFGNGLHCPPNGANGW